MNFAEDKLSYSLISLPDGEIGVEPHAHQAKKQNNPPKQKNTLFFL
jgi:hypothetical protein